MLKPFISHLFLPGVVSMSLSANLSAAHPSLRASLSAAGSAEPCAYDWASTWQVRAQQLIRAVLMTGAFIQADGELPRPYTRKLNEQIQLLARAITLQVAPEGQAGAMAQLPHLLSTLQRYGRQFGLEGIDALEALANSGPQQLPERVAATAPSDAGCAHLLLPTPEPSPNTPPQRSLLACPPMPAAHAQMHNPIRFVPSRYFAAASKIALIPECTDPASLQQLGWPDDWRVRLLQTPTNARYLISQSVLQGAYGKIRCAVDTATLLPWIIKEFRVQPHADPEGISSLGQLRTHVDSEAAVHKELQLMAQLSEGLLAPREVVRCGAKVLAIVPRLAGDVRRLLFLTPPIHRRDMARAALTQMAQAVAHLHRADYMHGDIKLENALHTAWGQIVLSDYGAARICRSNHRIRAPVMGTYPAPEMLRGSPFSKRAETWSLGASVGDFFNMSGPNPLSFASGGAAVAQDKLADFIAWRGPVVYGDRVRLERIDETSVWGRYLLPLREQDPELCCFTLTRMLHPNPRRRASMDEVALFCQKRLRISVSRQRTLLQLYAHASTTGLQHKLNQALQHVALWQGYQQQALPA
jgi:serine/threonine protein kinase